jgi:hypothetical protein
MWDVGMQGLGHIGGIKRRVGLNVRPVTHTCVPFPPRSLVHLRCRSDYVSMGGYTVH